jgi:hypothetical protein
MNIILIDRMRGINYCSQVQKESREDIGKDDARKSLLFDETKEKWK